MDNNLEGVFLLFLLLERKIIHELNWVGKMDLRQY